METELVTIATFADQAEADRARTILESSGIRVIMSEPGPVGTVLRVHGADAVAAGDLLKGSQPAEEEELSNRQRDARRAFRVSVVSMVSGPLFPALHVYSWYLLHRVFFSTETLDEHSRRRAIYAGILNVALVILAVGVFVSFFLPPLRREGLDPRDLAHPKEMAGLWRAIADDGRQQDLDLHSRGRARYRVHGEPETEITGYWGVGDWFLFLHCRDVMRGDATKKGKLFGWDLKSFTQREIVLLEHGREIRFTRRNK
jgi:hypothetical protein